MTLRSSSKREANRRTDRRTSRSLGMAVALAVAAAVSWGLLTLAHTASAQEVTVYKSPWCGCCGAWADHMRDNGFDVTVREVENLDPIRAEHGITGELMSCHTAVVDGYVVEGHVPAEDVRRLLAERPDARGLTAPGMPAGSPGMEGAGTEPYAVLLFDEDGATTVYGRH